VLADRVVVHDVFGSFLSPVVDVVALIEVVPHLAIRSLQLIVLGDNLHLAVLTRVQLKGLFEKGSVVTGFDKFLIAEPA
jgi:hypothetical protein